MGKVLIIKNNNSKNDIHRFAQQSFIDKSTKYYNSVDGTYNECNLIKLKNDFSNNGLVVLITYKDLEQNEIEDVFIGDNVYINDKNSIVYNMRLCLTKKQHENVIASIIEKIDLNIETDFGYGRYVMMSSMESLYVELTERIKAESGANIASINKEIERKNENNSYELSALAQKDYNSIRIYKSNYIDENRTEFQRDRERIVNCKAFRRMVDKAQIFGSTKGDYYRTRMTHSLEVNQIAKAIAYALRLNLDLTEAIALGHDLGHTPFGHQGERTLDDILSGKIDVGIIASRNMFEQRCFGGFKHNYQSAKIITELEEKYIEFPGLNVSVQVVEGVLKHTKIMPNIIALEDFLSPQYIERMHIDMQDEQICSTLEGQTVAIADEIAQRGHDVDDALTSGVITVDEFVDLLQIDKYTDLSDRIKSEIDGIKNSHRLIVDKNELIISRIVSVIINYFIQNTIAHSMKLIQINKTIKGINLDNTQKFVDFPKDVELVNKYLEKIVQKKVICNNEVARADYNASKVVERLFEKYYKNPRLLHAGTVHKIFVETLNHSVKEVANSAINLNDAGVKIANKEIADITTKELDEELIMKYLKKEKCENKEDIVIFEKRKILIRAITDYIAGMTDGYALEEYNKLL